MSVEEIKDFPEACGSIIEVS